MSVGRREHDPELPWGHWLRLDGANGNVYATHPAAAAPGNSFARSDAPNRATAALTGTDVELNALVYPVWKLDAQLADDPNGVGGKSILTGTGPFDASDAEDGDDNSNDSGDNCANDAFHHHRKKHATCRGSKTATDTDLTNSLLQRDH